MNIEVRSASLAQEILLAFRPKTLTAALVPCLVATAWIFNSGKNLDWPSFAFALASAFCIQIATNLLNDAVDFKKGADTAKRIGPRRITQAGILSARTVLALGGVFLGAAILFGLPLLFRGGSPILIIGLCSAFLAYGYTGGPFPLAYLGLGDLFVVLFFGVIAVMGMSYLHFLSWDFQSLWLGLQIGFHAAVLIAINNLRDVETDALVGKKTLAVRWGKSAYKKEIYFLIWLPYLMNVYWIFEGAVGAALFPLLTLPLAIQLTKNISQTDSGPMYNIFLGKAALIHLLFGVLMSAGFVFL